MVAASLLLMTSSDAQHLPPHLVPSAEHLVPTLTYISDSSHMYPDTVSHVTDLTSANDDIPRFPCGMSYR
jgi:hypothetical protein